MAKTKIHTDELYEDTSTHDVYRRPLDGTYELVRVSGAALFSDGALATKITVSGAITYIGEAAPGTAQATAAWRCQKIDTSSGTVITLADGNSNFDNVATDLTALSYS